MIEVSTSILVAKVSGVLTLFGGLTPPALLVHHALSAGLAVDAGVTHTLIVREVRA